MITLVTVKNPFKPQDGREVRRINYTGSLQELFKENSITETDIHVTVNGYDVDNDYDL